MEFVCLFCKFHLLSSKDTGVRLHAVKGRDKEGGVSFIPSQRPVKEKKRFINPKKPARHVSD
jgi:hypothetical protein